MYDLQTSGRIVARQFSHILSGDPAVGSSTLLRRIASYREDRAPRYQSDPVFFGLFEGVANLYTDLADTV